jgi:hypothetical protein
MNSNNPLGHAACWACLLYVMPHVSLPNLHVLHLSFAWRFDCQVVLEIRGAGVNLTLVDLPGLIRFTEEEKDHSCVGMIRELIMSYIK